MSDQACRQPSAHAGVVLSHLRVSRPPDRGNGRNFAIRHGFDHASVVEASS